MVKYHSLFFLKGLLNLIVLFLLSFLYDLRNFFMRNIVIGVGNVLFKDEGVGIYASKYLEANYEFDNDLEIIEGGTLGFKLMTYFQEYDNVIILDTVSIEDNAWRYI